MAEAPHSAIEALAQHLARPVPEEIQNRARLHLLDWLGCVAGARRSPVAKVTRSGEPDPVLRAALLGNLLEMDDVHREALLHPGPVVWPAVLAAARERGSAMPDLLDAAVRGYEAAIAIGATFDAHHYSRWHNTATAGCFGAAAGAASLFGLDPGRTAWALGNAGSVAGGLWHMRHAPGAMTKQFHVVQAALTGVRAARLAAAGMIGPAEILEGPQGLYEAMTRTPRPLRVGEGWRIEEVSFKPWAACRHAHPAIDAALELRRDGALDGDLLVETYADAVTFCDRPSPASVVEAKFSIQHAVAVVAVRGEPEPEDFEPSAIADGRLAAMRAKVDVRESAEFSARYPAHFGARLTSGGRTVELVDTRGDPERPLGREGIIAKSRQLMAFGGLAAAESEDAASIALDGHDAEAVLRLVDAWL